MAVTAATRLGCGRDVDDVWATTGSPPSAHEQTCPYCQTARANLADLAAATEEMTAADRADPLLRFPSELLADILTIARSEVRRGRTIPLQRADAATAGDGGSPGEGTSPDLTVSELAIATVVRRASDQVQGAEAGRCSIAVTEPQPADGGPAVESGRGRVGIAPVRQPVDVRVQMEVSISRTTAIGVLSLLRREVVAAVAAQIGVTVSRVDIVVRDVHDA